MLKNERRYFTKSNVNIARYILFPLIFLFAGISQFAHSTPSAVIEEVVVTARKREESLQEVPVAVNVVTEQTINNFRVEEVDDLMATVPGLVASDSSNNASGMLYLRGIGSSGGSPFMQQAVAVNIDGVQVDDAGIMQASMMDMAQIEVMRGPQALFFGKNSPGGVIAMHSKDPNDQFELILSADYEIEAREKVGTIVVSGPLTDALGGRLAVSSSEKDGEREVIGVNASRNSTAVANFIATGDKGELTGIPGTEEQIAFAPENDTFLIDDKLFARGTLLFQPTADFDVRAKVNYQDNEFIGTFLRGFQRIHCPQGKPQAFVAIDSCKADNKIFWGRIDPNMLAALSKARRSEPDGIFDTEKIFSSLEMNYHFSQPGLTLTSITGYFDSDRFDQLDGSFEPASILALTRTHNLEQLSQELRLTSNWDKRFNFMVGAIVEERENFAFFHVMANSFLDPSSNDPIDIGRQEVSEDGKTWSIFAQSDMDIISTLNISVGARFTRETKEITDFTFNDSQVSLNENKKTWENVSPEVTLTYFPGEAIMVYASYKEGFKSGGFDGAFQPVFSEDREFDVEFDQEEVSGFEIGIKADQLFGVFTLNVTAFEFDYDNLQLGQFNPETLAATVENAAKATIKGIEVEAFWATPIRGLKLRGNLNYLDSEYGNYLASCYIGQTVDQGCNRKQNPNTGAFTLQDLSDERMPFAGEWTGNFGLDYERALTANWNLGLSIIQTYTSGYITNNIATPNSEMDSFSLTHASVRLFPVKGSWEFAIKGRNLTDEIFWTEAVEATLTGGGTGTDDGTLADVAASIQRGRAITFGVKYKFD